MKKLLLLIAAATAPNIVQSEAAELQHFASLSGTCERLVVDGHDLTPNCTSNMILQSAYADGRTGWYLTVGDKGAVVTLSGMSRAKPDVNSQIQTLDRLIFNLGISGVKPSQERLSGSCLYSNPYLGPTSITCTAKNTKGEVTAMEFRTDGSAPQFMNGE